jgi:hypothetical protein
MAAIICGGYRHIVLLLLRPRTQAGYGIVAFGWHFNSLELPHRFGNNAQPLITCAAPIPNIERRLQCDAARHLPRDTGWPETLVHIVRW